jgi:hypothetical protein
MLFYMIEKHGKTTLIIITKAQLGLPLVSHS